MLFENKVSRTIHMIGYFAALHTHTTSTDQYLIPTHILIPFIFIELFLNPINWNGFQALLKAMKKGQLEKVQKYLSLGANVNYAGQVSFAPVTRVYM